MRIMLRKWRWYLTGMVMAGLLAPPVHADGLGVVVQRVDTAQFPNVRVYVSVANPNGIPITGLDQQAFQVQEDGKPVEGVVVEPTVDSQEPILTGLVMDVSGSMNDEHKLERAKEAATAFIDALGPSDRVTLVSFASQVKVVQDYTADKAALKGAIGGLVALGNTLLYDAVAQTAKRQATQPERRKPLIVLTDGEDTASAASIEAAILAATSGGSAVYTIGLGSDVNKDILGRIATSTGGQAVYVTDAADLKTTFLSINDQLRRQYVLRYTSKLSADTRPHGVAVQAAYSGQTATGLKSFTMPTPASVTVNGLNTAGSLFGVQHVSVDVTGGAQSVQFLVDDKVVDSARSAPVTFDWETARETPGPHRVLVKVVDSQGVSVDKPFSVVVAAPAAPTAAAPTAASIQVLAAPTAAPVAAAVPQSTGIDNSVLVGLLLLLFLVGATVWYLRQNRTPVAVAAAGGASRGEVTQVRGDRTEVVGAAAAGGATFIRPGRDKPPPQVRLLIVQHGQQSDFVTRDSPITLGRAKDKATVAIDDPLVSSEHARIRRDGAQFSIEDLKSKNGTQINGEPMVPEKRRTLKSNDRIYMGDTVVTFVVDSR